jgi:hypothetical protein
MGDQVAGLPEGTFSGSINFQMRLPCTRPGLCEVPETGSGLGQFHCHRRYQLIQADPEGFGQYASNPSSQMRNDSEHRLASIILEG